jgi:hypothetical protein
MSVVSRSRAEDCGTGRRGVFRLVRLPLPLWRKKGQDVSPDRDARVAPKPLTSRIEIKLAPLAGEEGLGMEGSVQPASRGSSREER